MSREYSDYVLDMLRPRLPATARRMFGGFGLFASGLMFGLIFEDRLYLKTDDANRGDFEAAGAAPFCYSSRGKTVTLSYWEAPDDIADDPEALQQWAAKACAAARSAAEKKKKPAAQKRKTKK